MMMVGQEARVQQRERALQEANRVRMRRADIKRQLSTGEVELAGLVMEPPEEIYTVKIGSLLEWAPGIGPFRSSKILMGGYGAPGVGRNVKLEHLSHSTRQRICKRIELTHPVRFAAAG